MGLTISINDQAAFNVVIGVPGPQGIQGATGPTGPAGAGIIPGGTAGQLLSKIDSTNYNTQWADPLVFTGGPITSAITLTLGGGNFFTGLFDREVYGVDYTDGSFFDCFNNGIYTGNDALGYMGMSTDGLRFTDGSVQTTAASLFTGGPITSAITLTDGSMVTGFESGAFYVNRTDGYSATLQLNNLSLSSDTQSIGIAAAGITFADATFQSTAALPFTGGEVANPITMHDGSSDSEMSASVFGVELTSDTTQNASLSYTGLNVQITGSAMNVTATGITFPDSTTQTTSATNLGYINQTTADTLYYPLSTNPSGFIGDATSDGQTYGRNNGAWTVVGGGSATWGGITGTLSSQTDLQSALDAKYDASNPSGFIGDAPYDGQIYGRLYSGWSTLASQGYITQTTADGLYYGISNPSGFVDGAYVSSALTGYATESFVTGQGYINQTTADGLYYSITNPAPFITQGTADTLYYSITNPSGFVDGTFVTSQGYITQTTADSLYYSISNPSSFITQGTADGLYYGISNPAGYVDGSYVSNALIGYVTESYLVSQGYVDASYVSTALYGYATESFVTSQGYVDSSYVTSALTGYATESFVTSQGYITQTTADGLYYPQTNPNNFITPPYNDGSLYAWQYWGWTALDFSGFVGPAPVDGTSYNRTDNAWTQNITFADSTVQTTAAVSGIPEAPIDGNYYVRKDGAWVQAVVVTLNHSSTDYNFLTIP